MSKTDAQLDKKKREVAKRKQMEKIVKKIAADMPDDQIEQKVQFDEVKINENKTDEGKFTGEAGVKCLRCNGAGHSISDCDICKGRGITNVSCRKCLGKGTYSQKAGPCTRCDATGVLADGHKCPRCKGYKVQIAFSSPCVKCSGAGSLDVPCKRCNGTLKYEAFCVTCSGTGLYKKK